MHEKTELKLKKLVDKTGKIIEKDNKPIEIILSRKTREVEFPQDVVKLEICETIDGTDHFLYFIYVGEIFYRQTIQSICPNFKFPDENACEENIPYVFVTNSNGNLVFLAKLNKDDRVVENVVQLKMLLQEIFSNYQQELYGNPRIREINNER